MSLFIKACLVAVLPFVSALTQSTTDITTTVTSIQTQYTCPCDATATITTDSSITSSADELTTPTLTSNADLPYCGLPQVGDPSFELIDVSKGPEYSPIWNFAAFGVVPTSNSQCGMTCTQYGTQYLNFTSFNYNCGRCSYNGYNPPSASQLVSNFTVGATYILDYYYNVQAWYAGTADIVLKANNVVVGKQTLKDLRSNQVGLEDRNQANWNYNEISFTAPAETVYISIEINWNYSYEIAYQTTAIINMDMVDISPAPFDVNYPFCYPKYS